MFLLLTLATKGPSDLTANLLATKGPSDLTANLLHANSQMEKSSSSHVNVVYVCF